MDSLRAKPSKVPITDTIQYQPQCRTGPLAHQTSSKPNFWGRKESCFPLVTSTILNTFPLKGSGEEIDISLLPDVNTALLRLFSPYLIPTAETVPAGQSTASKSWRCQCLSRHNPLFWHPVHWTSSSGAFRLHSYEYQPLKASPDHHLCN